MSERSLSLTTRADWSVAGVAALALLTTSKDCTALITERESVTSLSLFLPACRLAPSVCLSSSLRNLTFPHGDVDFSISEGSTACTTTHATTLCSGLDDSRACSTPMFLRKTLEKMNRRHRCLNRLRQSTKGPSKMPTSTPPPKVHQGMSSKLMSKLGQSNRQLQWFEPPGKCPERRFRKRVRIRVDATPLALPTATGWFIHLRRWLPRIHHQNMGTYNASRRSSVFSISTYLPIYLSTYLCVRIYDPIMPQRSSTGPPGPPRVSSFMSCSQICSASATSKKYCSACPCLGGWMGSVDPLLETQWDAF